MAKEESKLCTRKMEMWGVSELSFCPHKRGMSAGSGDTDGVD